MLRALTVVALSLLLTGCCATGPCDSGCDDTCEAGCDEGCEDACEAPAELAVASLGTTKNVHVLGDVYTAGQPARDDFALIAEAGVRTVISVRGPGEVDFDEAALVAEHGMTFHNPGFQSPDQLTDAKMAELRQLLETAERPILFHCGSANRVGAQWMAWRVLDGGLSLEEAEAEADEVGLRSDALRAASKAYIARQQGEG